MPIHVVAGHHKYKHNSFSVLVPTICKKKQNSNIYIHFILPYGVWAWFDQSEAYRSQRAEKSSFVYSRPSVVGMALGKSRGYFYPMSVTNKRQKLMFFCPPALHTMH